MQLPFTWLSSILNAMLSLKLLSLLLVFSTVSISLKANETQDPKENPRGMISRSQDRISSEISDIGRSIDDFFSNSRVEDESNRSTVRLGTSALFENKQDPRYEHHIHAHLKLPQTQEKLHFLLQNLEDSFRQTDEKEDIDKSSLREGVEKQSLFAR